MKKLIMILVAAAAFSCGDGNRSSERNDDAYDKDNTEALEADSTTVDSDTTSTGDMDRRQDDGDMDRGEAGTERDSL